MPWEKQFDVEGALDAAMRTFWRHGYEGTSVQDLVNVMGVNRGSLYDTFGDKRALFIRALSHYDGRHRQEWTEKVSRSASPKASILAVFAEVVDAVLGDGHRDGCLLVNTALEVSPHDAEIGGMVGEALRKMEAFFRSKIQEGQLAGEIPDRIDGRETAAALLSLFVGLRVLSRSRPEDVLLRSIQRQAATFLE